jgi:hypothetical protein
MHFLLMSLFLTGISFAQEIFNRPKSFSHQNSQAVFVDFTEANYHITYDLINKKAFAEAEINFVMPEQGYPVFDSVTAPQSVSLDGLSVSAVEVKTPQNETTLRIVNKVIPTGEHSLLIKLPLSTLVEFFENGVKSAFWTSDLDEREFLERYLPANLEYDQVKMNFHIKFVGLKNQQVIYTNGEVTTQDASTFHISYPEYYNASSIFFHTVPKGLTQELRFKIKSIDGRELPAVVYFASSSWGASLEKLKNKTIEIIRELESDYGPFPHPSLTIYQAGMGGMEYCGATMTDFSALGHELFHSYFARGVMPANGNAGWLDEALASWRDGGYTTSGSLLGTSGMSSHPYYTRTTDKAAYTFGARFMSFLDGKTKSNGGLKPFMKMMVEKKIFSPLLVDQFIDEMNNFYGQDFREDFKKYTFSKRGVLKSNEGFNPIHQKMSIKELQKYL